MLIDTCSWDHPGADAYTGSATAAIYAMAPDIPVRVKRVFAERAERHEVDDVVYIDRDSIRGKYAYEPEISFMAFGSKGRICANVTRNKWSPDHVESAIVICEQGWCVARPSVCNNWSLVTRHEPAGPAAPPVALLAPPEAFGPPASEVGAPGPTPLLLRDVPLEAQPGEGDGPSAPLVRGPVFLSGLPVLVEPVTPVPEPTVLWLMIVGLVAIAWKVGKRYDR
jgi:hypothetical protein